MELQRFFEHWNLAENPFQAEEARNDSVYNRIIEGAITHPDFAKIYGEPTTPSTAIVFGEKGSGKTAMRLMMEKRFEQYNAAHEANRVWVVRYDDLNPLLDRLSQRLHTEDSEKVLGSFRLADHQDAILSSAVTELLDTILSTEKGAERKLWKRKLRGMSPQKRVDLAVLALLYDQPRQGQTVARWQRLKRLLKVGTLWNRRTHGLLTLLFGIAGLAGGSMWQFSDDVEWYWPAAGIAGVAGFVVFGLWWMTRGWRNAMRARRAGREIRVVSHTHGVQSRQFWDLSEEEVAPQPIPHRGDQDNRYELTSRFIQIINELGYKSVIVLMDRVDEPVLINGETDRMKRLVWPMLNNKFLQQENFGVKMLLPIEISHLLTGESSDFKRQARLDKQNLVNPLRWTGATLYDLCTWRFQNCQKTEEDRIEQLSDLFAADVESQHLIDALEQMHQPRDAFKFLYAVILEHCQNIPGDSRDFRIPRSTLEHVRREQSQRVTDLYRGVASN